MKKIILFLGVLLIISCKQDSKVIVQNEVSDNKENDQIFNSFGDSLIADQNFINQIKNSRETKDKRILLSKIKFDYEKFNSWDYNHKEEKQIGKIILKFKKINTKKEGARIFTNISLSSIREGKIVDDILIYKQENYDEALVAINQYFYIDKSLNLWTLELNEDEEGISLISWKTYKIDKITGEIKLINGDFVSSNESETINNDNVWTGHFLFEKSNRDDLKTSFDILINDLNDINITYIGDGEKPEIYKNLKAEKVEDDKIKIVFNKKYQNMGIIYIQNYEKEYIISGEPISNINPGNDEYSIRKIN